MKLSFLLAITALSAFAGTTEFKRLHCISDYQPVDGGYREFFIEQEEGKKFSMRTRMLKGNPWEGTAKIVDEKIASGLTCSEDRENGVLTTCSAEGFRFELLDVLEINPETNIRNEFLDARWTGLAENWHFSKKAVRRSCRDYCEIEYLLK